MAFDIDLGRIRPYGGDKRLGFEELVCQLARREHAGEQGTFRRVEGAGGDGGVEAYFEEPSGAKVGYQAKYFLATKDIDWTQIDRSVRTAIGLHPSLKRYVVAIACDLTCRSGKLGKGKTGWKHWEHHTAKWTTWCSEKGMDVQFVPWTKFDIVDRLASSTECRGLVLFWFNQQLFDASWFASRFEVAKEDLGERFQPDDNVVTDLSMVFSGLVRSNEFRTFLASWFIEPFDVDDLTRDLSRINPVLADRYVPRLREILFDLRTQGGVVLSIGSEPLPIAQWQEILSAASDWTGKLFSDLYETDRTHKKGNKRDSITAAKRLLHILASHLDRTPVHLYQNEHDVRVQADLTRTIVVVGEAGSGKSHLFADAVGRAVARGRPALLLLGQHFHGNQFRRAFLDRLDLANHDFRIVLQALNSAAEAAGERCMILIDALNEATDLKVWRDDLAGVVSEILTYEWLCVGVSCRPEYEKYLIPEGVRQKATLLVCRGIRSPDEQEQAAIQYFEKRGIVRPAVPWLAPEFSNFLFLKVCCDALRNLGRTEFPRGLHGAQEVFRFYLESLTSKVRCRFPEVDFPAGAVLTAVRSIATRMARDHVDHIETGAAKEICHTTFGGSEPRYNKSWFSVLCEEGLFRKDHLFDAKEIDPFETRQEVFRFTYQKFSDHLVVEAFLQEHSDLHAAFQSGGGMRFLVEGEQASAWSTAWTALAVQIPEKLAGLEVFDILPDDRSELAESYVLQAAFKDSLLWRSSDAFSDRTLQLFNDMEGDWYDPRLEILIRLSTLRDHPWNARQLLDPSLRRMPMPARDAFWTIEVNRATEKDGHPAWVLMRWCLRADLSRAESQTLDLAATVLCWFFASSNRKIRDTATKALIAVIAARPSIYPDLLQRFIEVDDLYVGERVCAAGFGAAVRIGAAELKEISHAIYEVIFASGEPPVHLNLRDYAQAIVQYAALRECIDERIDLVRCTPPYKSSWPLEDAVDAELTRMVEEAGGIQILHSALEWGDFGRYVIQSRMRNFSDVSLVDSRPLNQEEQRDASRLAKRANRDLPPFDVAFAKRWVVRRAYAYGWNAQLFPSDRSSEEMGSQRPLVERIGKKYQWLALSELMARLSDNVWTIGSWSERALVYDHPAHDWFVRDVEPSVLTDHPAEEGSPWWQRHSLPMEPLGDMDLAAWPFRSEAPNSPDWLQARASDGREWLLLYGLFTVRERRDGASVSKIGIVRHTFVRVSSIIVTRADVEVVFEKLKGQQLSDPSDHDAVDWTDGPFLCEYPWRDTWTREDDAFEEGFRSLKGIRYMRPVARHVWESHLDISLSEGARFCVPHPWVGSRMMLRPCLQRPGELLDARTGEVAFLDPSRGASGRGALVDEDKFFEFLGQENLECLWIIAGERNAYPSGIAGDFACRYFGSVYRRENGSWIGHRWHEDRKRLRKAE